MDIREIAYEAAVGAYNQIGPLGPRVIADAVAVAVLRLSRKEVTGLIAVAEDGKKRDYSDAQEFRRDGQMEAYLDVLSDIDNMLAVFTPAEPPPQETCACGHAKGDHWPMGTSENMIVLPRCRKCACQEFYFDTKGADVADDPDPTPTLEEIHDPQVDGYDAEDDVPLRLRRELLRLAASKSMSFYYLCAIYRQGWKDARRADGGVGGATRWRHQFEAETLKVDRLTRELTSRAEAIALFVEHLRDGYASTAEPVSKVARLIREKFGRHQPVAPAEPPQQKKPYDRLFCSACNKRHSGCCLLEDREAERVRRASVAPAEPQTPGPLTPKETPDGRNARGSSDSVVVPAQAAPDSLTPDAALLEEADAFQLRAEHRAFVAAYLTRQAGQ